MDANNGTRDIPRESVVDKAQNNMGLDKHTVSPSVQ